MDKSKTLINGLNVKPTTKSRMLETLALMFDTDDKTRCQNFRFELQGMINSLESEGLISTSKLEQLGAAFGELWKRRNRSFYLTQKAIEKAIN